jgi:hypothetical protein
MKIAFYGPINSSSIVRTVNNNIYTLGDSDTFQLSMQTTATPSGVNADSDYGFNLAYLDSAQ